jgi:hypothetical protein
MIVRTSMGDLPVPAHLLSLDDADDRLWEIVENLQPPNASKNAGIDPEKVIKDLAPSGGAECALMVSLKDDPEHWRKRAEDLRTLAEDMSDRVAKTTLLNLAVQYESVARRAEIRARFRQNIEADSRPGGSCE